MSGYPGGGGGGFGQSMPGDGGQQGMGGGQQGMGGTAGMGGQQGMMMQSQKVMGGQQGMGGPPSADPPIRYEIERGTPTVTMACFVVQVLVSVNCLVCFFYLTDIVMAPVHYLLNAFCFCFGVIGICIENTYPALQKGAVITALNFLHEYAYMLMVLKGRGMFYIFMATMFLVHMHPVTIIIGLLLAASGGATIAQAFKYDPTRGKQGYPGQGGPQYAPVNQNQGQWQPPRGPGYQGQQQQGRY